MSEAGSRKSLLATVHFLTRGTPNSIIALCMRTFTKLNNCTLYAYVYQLLTIMMERDHLPPGGGGGVLLGILGGGVPPGSPNPDLVHLELRGQIRLYAPVVPLKTIPDSEDHNGQNLYPFSDQNGSKTILFRAAHTYIAYVGGYPRDQTAPFPFSPQILFCSVFSSRTSLRKFR